MSIEGELLHQFLSHVELGAVLIGAEPLLVPESLITALLFMHQRELTKWGDPIATTDGMDVGLHDLFSCTVRHGGKDFLPKLTVLRQLDDRLERIHADALEVSFDPLQIAHHQHDGLVRM